MSKTPTSTHTAFRYMTRFRCIGGDCEASCCTGGWKISIDREHYEKTKHAMGSSPALRREFDAKMKRVKGVTDKRTGYALIVLQSNGDCGFFGEDRMCGLQKRYGEGVLSDTCTVYPRMVAKSGKRLELAGVASCPEVARQLLLHPDALELDEVPASMFPRPIVQASLADHPADPYTRYHDELRNFVMDVLSDLSFPLRSRLSFVAYFANRTVDFLYKDATSLDEERLLSELERILNPAFRAELFAQFNALPTDLTFPSKMVLQLVELRVNDPDFLALLEQVFTVYTRDLHVENDQGIDLTSRVGEIVSVYEAHQKAWEPFFPRLDAYLTNYAKNYWAREWYAASPNLLTHTVQLLLRLATMRFLIFGHPLLMAAVDKPDPERELALAKVVVQVVQRFSRVFEHDPKFIRGLQEQMTKAQVVSLAHATCLANF